MEKYEKPKIISVELDQSQAILYACRTNGGYFNESAVRCLLAGEGEICPYSVRGVASGQVGVAVFNAMPS
ncbi:MAG: hypothetical protein PHP69_06410 [Candidatus Omnitrophica bacterium]|nr:hypothetical protein [Candidatus Omnitrophota bacterium]MDD5080715.1 hypothetical protein [Candidatus Omnitrophota bacterium]MDD5440679.1 hypothetical protein [Candidatus Omnitrophota bacterium]